MVLAANNRCGSQTMDRVVAGVADARVATAFSLRVVGGFPIFLLITENNLKGLYFYDG